MRTSEMGRKGKTTKRGITKEKGRGRVEEGKREQERERGRKEEVK